VLDPFCGCGTAVVAAQTLNRKWIGIDVTHLAINLMRNRLKDSFPGMQFDVIGELSILKARKRWLTSRTNISSNGGRWEGWEAALQAIRKRARIMALTASSVL
jgi:hypothetical protein